jgi:EAL domain-containing protein (putative c-di-GMP-specific phosphodiesterase class I)
VPIGEWVLDQACSQLRRWQDAGWAQARVAVNLSAMQFSHSGLVEMLEVILDRYRIKPESLTLEITETTAMQNAEISIVILQNLRRLGVRIAIDDFGTGYSSLLYLKRLPVSELKIDRGFVHDLTFRKEDVAIVEAVVTLANKLGLRVVAEGVETPEQHDLLMDLGCDYLQGYLLGRPVHPETLLGLVTADKRVVHAVQP